MTTITRPDVGGTAPKPNFFMDALTMTRRNLLRLSRTPQVIVFSTIQPLMFVFLFNFVFGGSIDVGIPYIDYLIPGVLVQTSLFAGSNTAIGLAQDLESGALDRFRSLPMARSAVLVGRTLADASRSLITATVIILVGLVLGFRPASVFGVIAGVAIGVLFAYSFTWVFTFMALKVKDVEAVQAAAFIPVFPLVFAASTFAPVDNMPQWLQEFASRQPVTLAADTMRALFIGGEVGSSLFWALVWIFGILAVASTLAIRTFSNS